MWWMLPLTYHTGGGGGGGKQMASYSHVRKNKYLEQKQNWIVRTKIITRDISTVCAHEINLREINSHGIDSYKNFSRDQLLGQLL